MEPSYIILMMSSVPVQNRGKETDARLISQQSE